MTQETLRLEQEVARHRAELAGTVSQLGRKLDVKTQAGLRVEQAVDRATTDTGRPRPVVLAGAGLLVATAAALLWWRLRG